MAVCLKCGFKPPVQHRKVLWARKYVNHSSEKGTLCSCGAFCWYLGSVIEQNVRVGRPRLGKTHQRSDAAKAARNAKRNRKRKLSKKVHWTSSILDGQLIKSKHRPGKPTLVTIVTVPAVVAAAIRNLSELPAVKPVRKPKRVIRTPRKRTRSQQIERLQALLEQQDVMNDVKRWDRINMRLEEEYLLQARRDVHENLQGKFIWSDTPESVYSDRHRERRKEDPEVFKRYGIVFDN